MEKIAVFGSIFTYEEEDYVFLAFSASDGVLYTAKILDDPDTDTLVKKFRAAEQAGVSSSPVFYFVILTTEDFEDRAVHFARTESNNITISTLYGELNDADKEKLLQEVMEAGTPPRLKQLLKSATE
jgi:hypothetical protein